MNTSAFNLLPWRERQRSQTMLRWRWGLVLSLLCSFLLASLSSELRALRFLGAASITGDGAVLYSIISGLPR